MERWRRWTWNAKHAVFNLLDRRWRIRQLRALTARRNHGFSESALAHAEQLALDATLPLLTRRQARIMADNWRQHPLTFPETHSPRHYDVVMMSALGLPGGTTGSNIQEITAQRQGGLTTGLVHHPVWSWHVSRPIDSRVANLIDGDQVRRIALREKVTCDLLVVRVPKMGEHLMDDMPEIDAARSVVIINQPPYYEYTSAGGVGESYDLERVVEGFGSWIPDATWYPIGPRVRDVLETHHQDQWSRLNVGSTDWVNIIDTSVWRRTKRPQHGGPVRIGRHSRDFPSKWLGSADELLGAYPADTAFDVRVLGGAEVPRSVLGSLPRNWTVYPYNSVPVPDFLQDLDVYVYFPARDYAEAFGRAPLEAIAAGVPTIVPEEFRPLFGDAALYCSPQEVPEVVARLMADADTYEDQVQRGIDHLESHFSYGAHIKRLQAHGVRQSPA